MSFNYIFKGMCKWVIAMTKYDKVAKVVAPKKQRLAAAQAVYDKAMAALAIKQAQLREVSKSQLVKITKRTDNNL